MSSIEETFESAWSDTVPGLWKVSAGSGVSSHGPPKGPGDSAGWGKDVGGSHVTIEENEPEEMRIGSVSRGENDMLN